MSYILDALKKSEAERANADPEVSDSRVSFASAPGRPREIWPYLLALALLANAAVIGYLVWPETSPVTEGVTSDKILPVEKPEPSQPAVREAEPESPAPEPVEATDPIRESAPSGAQAQSQPPEDDVPPIHDMPSSVQQRVPEMTFNGHVWSSRPSSRSVMINNQMLREDARFQGMTIKEITAAGVIFRLDGHVFEIDIVRDWQGGSG